MAGVRSPRRVLQVKGVGWDTTARANEAKDTSPGGPQTYNWSAGGSVGAVSVTPW